MCKDCSKSQYRVNRLTLTIYLAYKAYGCTLWLSKI